MKKYDDLPFFSKVQIVIELLTDEGIDKTYTDGIKHSLHGCTGGEVLSELSYRLKQIPQDKIKEDTKTKINKMLVDIEDAFNATKLI